MEEELSEEDKIFDKMMGITSDPLKESTEVTPLAEELSEEDKIFDKMMGTASEGNTGTALDDLPMVEEEELSEEDKIFDKMVGSSPPKRTLSSEPVDSLVTFDEEGAPVVNAESYSENDFKDPAFYKVIKDYMVSRKGTHINEMDQDEVINLYLNNMRGFASTNTVRVASEWAFLNGAEGEDMKNAQKAYALYHNMEGVFGDTTLREKAGAVGDILRSVVFDPVNLLSLGVGKIVTSGGLKVVSETAQIAAKQSFQKELIKTGSEKLAIKAAGKIFAEESSKFTAKKVADLAKRVAFEESIKGSVTKKVLNSTALKEIVAVGTFDGLAAAGADYVYQDSMLRTMVQDEYYQMNTGIAAIGSLVMMGGIAAGGKLLKKGAAVGPEAIKTDPKGVRLSELQFGKKVKTGKKSKSPKRTNYPKNKDYPEDQMEIGADFWVRFLLGNDKDGTSGLAQSLLEQGYGFRKVDKDDQITKWLADTIKEADPKEFRGMMGNLKTYLGGDLGKFKGMTQKDFAKEFRKSYSKAGEKFRAAGITSHMLGENIEKVTLSEFLDLTINGNKVVRGTKVEKAVGEGSNWLATRLGAPEGTIQGIQNRLIRLLVTNPSTTALNIKGYGVASTMNSFSDITIAALLNPAQMMVGKKSKAEVVKGLKDVWHNTIYKLRNTVDANTTFDEFQMYAQARPGAMKELLRVHPGGVEDLSKVVDGMDLNKTILGSKTDEFIDFAQLLTGVTAQDSYTKSIEFLTQMDKNLRKHYGKGYSKFMRESDARSIMATKEFAIIEAKSVDDTMKTIFSKSHKGPTPVGQVAGFIEDMRQIPGLGMLVPFGRFFNNTMAFFADNSGLSLGLRVLGKSNLTTSNEELIARAMVTATGIAFLVPEEERAIDLGLSVFQKPDDTGAVTDSTYDFPYGAAKALARLVAHKKRGEAPPGEVTAMIRDQFLTQVTRNVDASGKSIVEFIDAALGAEGDDVLGLLSAMAGKVTSQSVSAGTRFLDPINAAVGLARGEDYKLPDRNQGNKVMNDSFKYMDQIIMSLGIADYPQKFSRTQGKPDIQATKFISTVREQRPSSLDRVYNLMGIPTWKARVQIQDAKGKNRYNELFSKLNERSAEILLKNDRFRQGDEEERKLIFDEFAKKNVQRVKTVMSRDIDPGDREALLRMEIEGTGNLLTRKNVMDELGFDDLSDLSYYELKTIKDALDSRKWTKRR